MTNSVDPDHLQHLRCVRVAQRLAVLTLDHKVQGSNPARGGIHLMTVRHCTEPSINPCPAELRYILPLQTV